MDLLNNFINRISYQPQLGAKFFRTFFSDSMTTVSDNGAFSDLYSAVETGGQSIYLVYLEISLFVLIIAAMIYIIQLFLASKSNKRAEAKNKIMRVLVVTMIVSSIVSIVSMVVEFAT